MSLQNNIRHVLRRFLPVVLGITSSLATASQSSNISYYGVAAVDMDYYYIAENLFNKEEGIDYLCDANYESVCVVLSLASPDEYYRIPKITAWEVRAGQFYDIMP